MSSPLVEIGMYPFVPSWTQKFMLEAMTYKILITKASLAGTAPFDLIVEAWTNQFDQHSCDGEWHAIPLRLLETDDDCATYGQSAIVTSDRDFQFTYRAKRPEDEDYTWFKPHGINGNVKVDPPNPHDEWTQGPSSHHIHEAVYCGNFLCAIEATKYGFTHVLNVAENLDMVYEDGDPVVYHKIGMKDSAHNPIPKELISAAVSWLLDRNDRDNKILVHCRAGIGRAGSTVLAFLYARNRLWSYDYCKAYVERRRFIYPHMGLKETLEELYPRQEPPK